ncbi:hypothetical protein D3C76_1617290 [compost metagenome]
MQQAFERNVRTITDQFQVESIGFADGFRTREFKHLELGVLIALEGQCESRLVSRGEHPMWSLQNEGERFCMSDYGVRAGCGKIRIGLPPSKHFPSENGLSNYRQAKKTPNPL